MDIFRIQKIKAENTVLNDQIQKLQEKLSELHADEYYQIKQRIDDMQREMINKTAEHEQHIRQRSLECEQQLALVNEEIFENNSIILRLREEISSLEDHCQKISKQLSAQNKKLTRSKELYKSVEYAISNFFDANIEYANCKLDAQDLRDYDLISPSVILKLHCMDIKDLRKAYRENEKLISKLLEQYSSRYSTKANKSIYNLMVIALRAELQNILYDLKYEKLDDAIGKIKNVSAKYLKIAGEGNQNIAGTLTKFIGEIEYLFINAVKIEYNYYVKKEQAKQEQLAIREQMRQEAEERKALELEKKRVEKEEQKYNAEIAKLQENLQSLPDSSETEIAKLEARILELQGYLSDVVLKKDEISSLQNGKAGNVYIISNLGSFGDDVFKIGMTRRLDPQDRINELGSASVPFKFDVHSFIFSEDAVGLEHKLHDTLSQKRLNKVNLRKEFFRVTIDELEKLVAEIDPSAEFNKTMAAEEFRQSLSSDVAYTTEYESDDDED